MKKSNIVLSNGEIHRRNKIKREWVKFFTGVLFASPVIIGILVFTYYPAVQSLYYSFTNYDMFNQKDFIWFANYEMIFTLDPDTWKVIANTLIYAGVSVPLNLVLGFLLAQAANFKLKGITVYRTLFYLPVIIPSVASGLLFMDMFDTLGTLIGVGQRAGMVEKNGYMHGLNKAFMADAIGTTFGALVGTSTVSTYVESAAGVNAGGRSGLTAIVVAACFVLAMFFSPLFLAIPSQATAPAMILVGVMMMGDIKDIDFQDFLTAIPCFLCIVLMPMTYSISNGILMGLICWVVLHLLSGQVKSMKASTLILAVLFVLKYIFL